jgi:hypothetical protein
MEMGLDQIERRTALRDPHLLLNFAQSRMAASADLSREFRREEKRLELDRVWLVWLVFVICLLLTPLAFRWWIGCGSRPLVGISCSGESGKCGMHIDALEAPEPRELTM